MVNVCTVADIKLHQNIVKIRVDVYQICEVFIVLYRNA